MNEVVYKYVIFLPNLISGNSRPVLKQTLESNPVSYYLKCHSTKKKQYIVAVSNIVSQQFVLFEKEKEISHIILTPKFNLRKFTLYRSHTTYTAIAPSGVSEFTYTQKNDARGRCSSIGVHRFLESKCAWGPDQTHITVCCGKKMIVYSLSYSNDNMRFSYRVLINFKFFFVK